VAEGGGGGGWLAGCAVRLANRGSRDLGPRTQASVSDAATRFIMLYPL
jgi:hypothetical protein